MENFEKEIKREELNPETLENQTEGGVLEKEPFQENIQGEQPEIVENNPAIPIPESEKTESVELNDKEVEYYLNLAREKGPLFAIEKAKQANNPNLLDKVHDALAQD